MARSFVLCDTRFWDNNLTWHSEKPNLTLCFKETTLVWLPSCILVIALFNECFSIRKTDLKKIPWNPFNTIRIFITSLLFLLKFCESINYIYITFVTQTVKGLNSNQAIQYIVISNLVAPIIQTLSHFTLILLYIAHQKNGTHTSRSVWFYLFIFMACDLINFYSLFTTIQYLDTIDLDAILKCAHFPVLVLLFLIECRGDTPVREPDIQGTNPDSPELGASYFSSFTFWWFNGFLVSGYRNRLTLSNLWKVLPRDRADLLVPNFIREWARKGKITRRKTYRLANGDTQQVNSVYKVLIKLLWGKFLIAAGLKLVQDCLQLTTPMILKKLLRFMASDEPIWHGTFYAISLLLIPTVQSVFLGNYFYYMQLIGIHVRTMIIGAVYRKSLLLSGNSRMQSTSGEIVNLMSVDSQRFQDSLLYIHLLWSAPLQITIAILLLYYELGWSVFAGIACLALVLPFNAYIARRLKASQIKLMKIKDERVKQMNEVVSGIKVIKLYAWENSFIARLINFRDREINYLMRNLNLDAFQSFLWQCCPSLVALITFAVYVNVDKANVLNAEKAFVSIALFNQLRFPMAMLPNVITSFILTMVSAARLNRFFNNSELVKYVTRNEELEAIAIEGGTLAWSQESDDIESENRKPILEDIDFHVKPKTFVAIVGQVASGKSSLLASIMGEMHRINGRFNVCKSMKIAYVPQQAWIQNMTVKDNILFGSPFNEERYKQVLSVCSLQPDLDALPGGDQSEIGEKGINLSGGQKQRVSLARACYSNSDIYLLDDPLSALDSHVAKHIFDKVLSSTTGLLRHKTRVLATNSLFVLPYVDHIVVLDNGRVVESGSYKELMDIKNGNLAESMRRYYDLQEDKNRTNEETSIVEQKSFEQVLSAEDKIMKSVIPKTDVGKLIEVENVETGSVNYRVYLSYFKSVSFVWLAFMMISLIASTCFNVGSNLWLSLWASDSDDPKKANDTYLRMSRLSIYALLAGLQCFFTMSGSLALSQGSVRASKYLHSDLLERVMHSPMTFFDTTPIGRVVNIFAKDIDVVDSSIPTTVRSWLTCLLQVVSTMWIVIYSFPTFTAIIVPLGIIYYLIQKLFIVTTRQLKRLESITRSPIYSHFSETLSGMSTIRAYDCVDKFVSHSDSLVDQNLSCSYPNIIANRWLSLRLEFFGNLIAASAALFSVYYKGVIGANVAGLTISYSLNITQTLSWLVRMTSDLETNIVSVERIIWYLKNKQEDLWVKKSRPPPEWPSCGAISIKNYSSRYREDTDLVLKDLNIDIKPKEKVGIVGRTGSGKSSLSLSLFRILEPSAGSIVIDNLDLVEYGLHDIRSRLTIIPQDPVLFSGTLRFNLDPLELYTDTEIWRSLELAHLKTHINAFKSGLDYQVIEFGENFSVGQRQLICLARAILRKSRILVLDEATASIDVESDSIVQKTIRDIFSDCTIITIAHRLHTILDSDRILVLDKGEVKELDSPANLIENPNSSLSSLVRDSGIDAHSIIKFLKPHTE